MPDLKSMKLDKSEKECCEPSSDKQEYPWGLTIRLDNESLKKLGITDLPGVGEEMFLSAKVEVTEVSEHSRADGKEPMKGVSLQITDMGLEGANTDKAKKLYGED